MEVRGPSRALFVESASLINGFDTNFESSLLDQFRPIQFGDEDEVRRMLGTLNLDDVTTLTRFGESVKSKMVALSGALTRLGWGKAGDILPSVEAIKDITSHMTADDIIGKKKKGALDIFGAIFAGEDKPGEEKLRQAIDLVDAQTTRIESALPFIDENIRTLDRVQKETDELIRSIDQHVMTGKIAVELYQSRMRPVIASRADEQMSRVMLERMDANLQILSRRCQSISDDRVTILQDKMAHSIMMDSYLALSKMARDNILELVANWKRNAAAAMMTIEVGGEGLAEKVGHLMASKDLLADGAHEALRKQKSS